MYTATFVICQIAAWWLDKSLKGTKIAAKTWWVPVGLALLGGMALYLSGLGTVLAGWLMWVLQLPTWLLVTFTGEYLHPGFWAGCIVGICVAVIIKDLLKDHTYNPKALTAMIVGPIAAIPATGEVARWLGLTSSTGADVAVSGVRTLFGG